MSEFSYHSKILAPLPPSPSNPGFGEKGGSHSPPSSDFPKAQKNPWVHVDEKVEGPRTREGPEEKHGRGGWPSYGGWAEQGGHFERFTVVTAIPRYRVFPLFLS